MKQAEGYEKEALKISKPQIYYGEKDNNTPWASLFSRKMPFDEVESFFNWEHRQTLDKAKNIVVKVVEERTNSEE